MAKRKRQRNGEGGLLMLAFYTVYLTVMLPIWILGALVGLFSAFDTSLPKSSPRGKHTARAQRYKGTVMDSGAEAKFAHLLDQHGIRWIKNTRAFPWKDGKRRKRQYVPDFYLPDFDLWVEIKGRAYYKNEDRTKWKHFPYDHEVVWASNIRLPRKIVNRL